MKPNDRELSQYMGGGGETWLFGVEVGVLCDEEGQILTTQVWLCWNLFAPGEGKIVIL